MSIFRRLPLTGLAPSRLMVCSLLIVAGSLVGCGEDQTQIALDDAARKLTSINAGANGRQWSSDKVYESVLQSLSSLPGSANDSQKSSASLLVSQAERGLGERDASQASDLMSEALRLIGPAEAELRAFASHTARAEAAEAFDPAPLYADLKARSERATAEGAKVQQEIDQRRAQAATLREQVAALRATADSHRLQAAELQAQADAQSAVAGVPTAQRAHDARRQADTIAIEALSIEQDAIALDQIAAELEIYRQKSDSQLAAQAKARDGLEQRAARIKTEASEARAAASQSAQALRALLSGEGGLDQFHATRISEPFEGAIRQYEASIRSAQAARSMNRGSASLAIGLAQHALANLHTTRGEGLMSYAAMLEAAGQQSVPGASEYASRAQQARQRAAEQAQAAADAYEAAISGYEASGARGDAADIRDSLAARLHELRALVLDEPIGAATGEEVGEDNGGE